VKQQLYVNGSWREKEVYVLDFGICLQVLHLDILCGHVSQTNTASTEVSKETVVHLSVKSGSAFGMDLVALGLLHVLGVTAI